ncbi:MAG: glycosyltransferase family 9 protein [Crocinitomicaceae bacterium]|nr:glycosyltransferase family 9 protein [Crocinitomicaceae bacterium]
MKHIKRLIISRTDSIGDVMLTLPMCAWIKSNYPEISVVFLGKTYTEPIVKSYTCVDEFVDWDEIRALNDKQQVDVFRKINAEAIIHVFPNKEIGKLARKSKIALRIGTSHRLHHFFTCNERVSFTRKGSELHEAQLNHELLRPLGLKSIPSLGEIELLTKHFIVEAEDIPSKINKTIETAVKTVILHPKSQGSAKEWPIGKYIELANVLAKQNIAVLFTGTDKEGALFRDQIPNHPIIVDTTGTLSLSQLIKVISKVDYLVACSTGPLHIAGYLGIGAVGLYSPKRPIHPGRWRALGKNVQVIVNDPHCEPCANKKDCNCVSEISVNRISEIIQ